MRNAASQEQLRRLEQYNVRLGSFDKGRLMRNDAVDLFASTSDGASKGVAFICNPLRKKINPARREFPSNVSFLSLFPG